MKSEQKEIQETNKVIINLNLMKHTKKITKIKI